jgi:2-dehydro-3-deoxyphosphogalactonate aldolase
LRLNEALAILPVVAIVRGIRPDEILEVADALYQAGVRGIETPLNSPEPMESLRRLTGAFGARMACGAGTVLSAESVEAAAAAGATIIVSPNTRASVIGKALALGLDPTPGVATATEAFDALEAGARHLKLFPASTYGPAHLRQLKAVLPPEVVVWGVGGIGADDFGDWWAAGARAFGVGSELYRPGQSIDETREKAARVVAAARALAR